MFLAFAALEIAPQAGKGRHERIVLHASPLLAPKTPSSRESIVTSAQLYARGASLTPLDSLYSERLCSATPEDGRHGRLRPTRVLAHGRGDGDAFCHDEGDGVNRGGYGAGARVEFRHGALLKLLRSVYIGVRGQAVGAHAGGG